MKVVILAGGFGTRISEETSIKPKPLVQIGEKPILWHIMKIYSSYGFNEFVICLGYKGYLIKEFFFNYALRMSDVTFDLKTGDTEIHSNGTEPWTVSLVDTGEGTMTGGRIKRIANFVGDETFCLTYGDGVSNVNIAQLVDFHRNQGALITLTAVLPPGRYGAFQLSGDESRISTFKEKPKGDGAWINGGFFVVDPKALSYIDGDGTVWEKDPMENVAKDGKLFAFKHDGFWHPMDTLRDKMVLEDLWTRGSAPWKVW